MKTSRTAKNMSRNRPGRILQGMVLLAAMLALSACATLKGKFTPIKEADFGIFADNTLAMLNEANFGFSKGNAIYTKEFFNREEPAEKRVWADAMKSEKVLRIMLRYSIMLVTITETEKTHEARIRVYTDYLAGIDDKALEALDLKRDYFAETIEKVSRKKKFMEALQAAQPIINALGRYMELTLTGLDEAVDALVQKVDQKIDLEYADVIRYQEALETEKYAVLAAMEQLYLTSKGDKAAFDRLLASGAIRSKKIIPEGSPTEEDIEIILEHLLKRLDRMHRIVEEIGPDWTNYRTTHQELDKLHNQTNMESRKVRLITIVWMRAHQKMASGRTSPAEWFDINDAPGALLKLGTSIVF